MILTLALVLFSCSTKKNTFTRRAYHNLTSHYNIYWNGRESLRDGELALSKKVKDNFTKVLPVFNFGTKQDAQLLNPQMDVAIKKGSIAIQKHSMIFNGEEKVKWIDDCYMLIGQAYFYKQEYISARRTFNFIIREYNKNDIKYDAMLWLVQTYHQTGEFEKAEPLLNLLTKDINDGKVSRKVIAKVPQVFANHYILQGKYDQAIDYLYEAISYNPKRQIKTRMLFILAQIYQQNGDLQRATNFYYQVVKRNPDYDMAFQAKINMAKSYDINSGDSRLITKTLNRMLKDDKNKDYKDQIYYALAEVALKDNNTEKAIEYLKLSVSSSTTNQYQKAASALALADIYFRIPEYENAQAYYDTTAMFMPKDFPNYDKIKAKTSVLSKLVQDLIVIQNEDSLQRVASMSEAERNSLIDKIISEYKAEQEKLREAKELAEALKNQAANSQFAPNPNSTPGAPGGGKWYFYNPSTKSFGYSEFVKKWGQRKLEDLWRLSDKKVNAIALNDTGLNPADSTVNDSIKLAANNPLAREYYLKGLPFTEEAVKESNNKIREAYFDLGKLYHDGLQNNEKSKAAFESLNEKFPGNEHELISYYYLYKIYTDMGIADQAELYKNLIISKYPDSDYAKILLDPQYFAKIAQEESKVSKLYEDTYKAYADEQYYMVIAKADLAFSMYGDTMALAPKFAYLKAISTGKVDVLDSLISQLQNIIKKYPNSSVKTLSQNLLAHIAQNNPEYANIVPASTPEIKEAPSPYTYNPKSQHMFMLIVDSREARLNPLKVKISDYNGKYYSLDNLSINSLVLDNKHYLVTVGNFNNSAKAMDFLNAISNSEYVYADLKQGSYQNYIISTENYVTFFKEKDIDAYKKFFDKNYKD